MKRESLINSLVQLGNAFRLVGNEEKWPGHNCGLTEREFQDIVDLTERCKVFNGWFTKENIHRSFLAWANELTEEKLVSWISKYAVNGGKKVAVIAAGNIPMVGFHDVLSVLVSENYLLLKCSSDDDKLIPMALQVLEKFDPCIADSYEIVTTKLENYNAVIATGSNNSGAYFEQYFAKVPNIIRKNRTSYAILEEETSLEDIQLLGEDIFNYFGLGCRNVSKIFIPKDFDIDRFYKGIFDFNEIIHHNKYANNYDYQKAIHLMNQDDILDNGFLLLKEDERLHAPLGMVYYSRYNSIDDLQKDLAHATEEVQCVVSKRDIPFGKSQSPSLDDYADNVDTMNFLANL